MNKSMLLKRILLGSATALVVAGCEVRYVGPRPVVYAPAPVVVEGEVEVGGPPPAPIVEVQPVAPSPDVIWVGGAWVWGGGRWGWNRGYWGHPPHRGSMWVPDRYVYRGGRHVFMRGHWR